MTKKQQRRMLVHLPAAIPDFLSEQEEYAFWDTHELADDFFDNAPAAEQKLLPLVLRKTQPSRSQ